MPLDFHAALSQEQASATEPVWSMSLATHKSLFGLSSNHLAELPMLKRIANYWDDAVYERDDLHVLVDEITRLHSEPHSPSSRCAIESLLNACVDAIEGGLGLYAFAD